MSQTKSDYLDLLCECLDEVFTRYADGLDVSPALRFRTEGVMQTGLSLELISEQALLDLKRERCQQLLQCPLPDYLAPLELPAMMKRAPVKPSTKD